MEVNRINEDLIEIHEPNSQASYRIERGPKTKTAIATPELLDDAVTASHYHADGGRDANGKLIFLGKEMVYHDWLGERDWKVYRLRTDDETKKWVKLTEKPTELEALAWVYSELIEAAGK